MLNITKYKFNNKGMSLVEMLVSLAVLAVVMTMLSAILFSVMNMAARTNANVTLQNESQTTMNIIMDELMGAKGLIFNEAELNDPDTPFAYIFTGALNWDGKSGSEKSYVGDVIIYKKPTDESGEKVYGNLYLLSYSEDNKKVITGDFAENDFAAVASAMVTEIKKDFPDDEADRKKYLMGKYVNDLKLNVINYDISAGDSSFYNLKEAEADFSSLKPDDNGDWGSSSSEDKYYYTEPLVLELDMDFEMEYRDDRTIARSMDDSVTVRNRLTHIYLKSYDDDSLAVFYLKK